MTIDKLKNLIRKEAISKQNLSIEDIKELIGDEGIEKCYRHKKNLYQVEDAKMVVDDWEIDNFERFPYEFNDEDYKRIVECYRNVLTDTVEWHEIMQEVIEDYLATKGIDFEF